MENIYKSMKAMIGFLIIIILTATFWSDKAAQNIAFLILLGMLILTPEVSNAITKSLTMFTQSNE